MVTVVPPVIGPDAGLIPVTVGTTGAHTQLSVTMLVPQYSVHAVVDGGLASCGG